MNLNLNQHTSYSNMQTSQSQMAVNQFQFQMNNNDTSGSTSPFKVHFSNLPQAGTTTRAILKNITQPSNSAVLNDDTLSNS